MFDRKKNTGISGRSVAAKLRMAMGSIILLLIVTIALCITEFRRMSTHVSDMMSENITTINLGTELAMGVDEYNTSILGAVGRADEIIKSNIDTSSLRIASDNIFNELGSRMYVYTDSLRAAFNDYYANSLQLDEIIVSDFVDTREWYFTVLQPQYNRFRQYMDDFNVAGYGRLQENSVSFDESFYRSIMPSVVSVATAIALCLLLQFYIMAYYVRPLKRMLKGMEAYMHSGMPYGCAFEGDDELQAMNGYLKDIIEDNRSLKKRLQNRES